MFSIIFVEIIAVIFDFYSSGRLGREQNLYQGMSTGGGGEANVQHYFCGNYSCHL